MIGTVIKSPLLPNTIHFNHTTDNQTEVMRITREGVWVNPDMQVDETAKAVLDALDYQVKVLVQKAVEDERKKVAQWMMDKGYATGHGDTVEDLLKEFEWQAKEREREACAKLIEEVGRQTAISIRARG